MGKTFDWTLHICVKLKLVSLESNCKVALSDPVPASLEGHLVAGQPAVVAHHSGAVDGGAVDVVVHVAADVNVVAFVARLELAALLAGETCSGLFMQRPPERPLNQTDSSVVLNGSYPVLGEKEESNVNFSPLASWWKSRKKYKKFSFIWQTAGEARASSVVLWWSLREPSKAVVWLQPWRNWTQFKKIKVESMSRVNTLNWHSHVTNLVLHGNLGAQGVVRVPLFRKGHSMLCPLVLGLQRSSDLAGLGVGRAGAGELLHTSVLTLAAGKLLTLSHQQQATGDEGINWPVHFQTLFSSPAWWAQSLKQE